MTFPRAALTALVDAHLAADADPDATRHAALVRRIRADGGRMVGPLPALHMATPVVAA